jgi:KamA family protein
VRVDAAARWGRLARRLDREKTIGEVILSGGDPLVLVDEELAEAIGRLAAVGSLRRLRIHTRMPVVIPSRVTDALLTALRSSRLTCWVVLQINHPQEIDDDVARAVARLVDAGIPVLSQSVLLRGVNDRAESLAELCERLIDLRVMPYYLHRLDRVAGAAHFDVPEHEGRRLIEKLRRRLPGYAVPRFVCEVPGESSKVPLD